jgi:hypothetical protein
MADKKKSRPKEEDGTDMEEFERCVQLSMKRMKIDDVSGGS